MSIGESNHPTSVHEAEVKISEQKGFLQPHLCNEIAWHITMLFNSLVPFRSKTRSVGIAEHSGFTTPKNQILHFLFFFYVSAANGETTWTLSVNHSMWVPVLS